ncbi:MAG: catalase [Myxococcota bacterium]
MLQPFRADPTGQVLTTDQGIPVANTDDSLKAGPRGPTLLEDFHLREKLTRFDHERIPERVVHARGAAAHGYFQVYASMAEWTRATFLCDPALKTPVFVRFSTVVGSRGSADTVRDVRGFAVKFYTPDGNFDLVGNNMPVFFIQDGIKFPDLIHAVKPEPANEIPQAASAHDTFWDFVSLVPESAHMVMWAMSDRALPRSYRMMEGFGVHTFRLIDAAGQANLVKFHWKPVLGAHSLAWDEAQKLSGKDPDYHRRDLWNAIETGAFPEYELGVQIVPEQDVLKYGFDLLDATKLLPEELVPVRRVGKMVLDRNPQNFFAETEQVAFHLGNLVPGIDLTNDPLLQARLFSYLDTQLTRLGGPNFAELPINRPVVPVHNHQQDGLHRTTIATGKANYHPNSIGGGCPMTSGGRGFVHYEERVESHTIRARSDSFRDHFSQAGLFVRSQSAPERRHLVAALRFELGKVNRPEIRIRTLGVLAEIDPALAQDVADGIGVPVPDARPEPPPGTSASVRRTGDAGLASAPSLSLAHQPMDTIRTRQVAMLLADGFTGAAAVALRSALMAAGAVVDVISLTLGVAHGDDGSALPIAGTFHTATSVSYDAVVVPGGADIPALAAHRPALAFVRDAFEHFKPIAGLGEARALFAAVDPLLAEGGPGVVLGDQPTDRFVTGTIAAIAAHRHWDRPLEG